MRINAKTFPLLLVLTSFLLSLRLTTRSLLLHDDISARPTYNIEPVPDRKAKTLISTPLPLQNNTSNDSSRVIFIISMGQEAAKTNLVERFVYSVRTLGKYSGYVLLLTDAPAERYGGLFQNTDIENDNFIVMAPQPAHFRTDFKQKDMVFKRFKTYVLDYVKEDSRLKDAQLVYYLDVDIVVTKPMIDLFQGLERTYQIGAHNGRTQDMIWMFEGNAERVQVQGGQMIIDVHRSAGCLSKWRKLIDKSWKTRKDQFPLMQMWKDQQKSKYSSCSIIRMAQNRYISFPSKTEVDARVSEILAVSGTRNTTMLNDTTLIHIKNTGSAGNEVNKTNHEIFVRDILKLRPDENDKFGITQTMHIKALKSDMDKLD